MADLISMLAAAAGAAATPASYQISRSLRFNSADTPYLSRSFTYTTRRKQTFSFWMKRSTIGASDYNVFGGYDGSANFSFRFTITSDALLIRFGGATAIGVTTTQLFRDVSAWYHVVVAIDTTDATSTNRIKLYVNGVQVQSFSSTAYPSQNADSQFGSGSSNNRIGSDYSNNFPFDGYLADVFFIQDQALTADDFGELDATTGVWKPKEYTGTYGTNGFHLDFSDNTSTTTIGYDAAGSNDWTANNFSVAAGAGNDSLVDTPTPYGTDTGVGGEVRGNYCTLNPIRPNTGTLSNGNLNCVVGNAETKLLGTIGMSSGKWYWEMSYTDLTADGRLGIATGETSLTTHVGQDALSWAYQNNGNKVTNQVQTAYGSSYTTNDVIGVAFDADNGDLFFYKNGTVQNSGTAAFTGLTSGPYFPAFGDNSSGSSSTFWANFGQRPFAYTAPSGYKALCTQNLPTPTVVQGDDYFNTVLYTGTGSSQSITGVGFQPDLVWIKERNAVADHALYDAVRGVQQQLESNTTTDETTESTGLTAFGSDGFTVGALAQLNTNTDTYVAWNWKESTTSKFDIVTYTGNGTARTISHNLGVVPNMIIVKARTTASTDQGWPVYHSANTAAPETDYLLLNSTAATADLDTVWNDTAPTSSVFSVGTNALVNANNDTYVAYVFAEVDGYSKFGSYTGNGSTDGPFVYFGFRPAFVMFKRSDSTSNWSIIDTTRDTYNATQYGLYPNLNNAESSPGTMDILSNGLKIRTTIGDINVSTGTYIFAAFAENPFKYSLAR